MDVWRWDVFNKDVNADHYNCHWWLLRFDSIFFNMLLNRFMNVFIQLLCSSKLSTHYLKWFISLTFWHFHRFRERYGGIKPPVLRSEMDFDPASKFHIPANIPYIRWVWTSCFDLMCYSLCNMEVFQILTLKQTLTLLIIIEFRWWFGFNGVKCRQNVMKSIKIIRFQQLIVSVYFPIDTFIFHEANKCVQHALQKHIFYFPACYCFFNEM